jgi:hypothetical protein
MGSQDTDSTKPEGTAQTPAAGGGGTEHYRHLVDIRFTTPRIFGSRRYLVLRMGRDIRDGPRPYTVPPRVRRRNRTAAALLVQMVLAWLVALLLIVAWLSQMGCGAQVAGGGPLTDNEAPGPSATEGSGAPETSVRAGPVLGVTPSALDFGSVTTVLTLTVRNAGTGTLTWQAAGQAPWVTVSPLSGSGAGSVKVTVNRTGMTVGVHQYPVRITSSGGTVVVPVKVTAVAPGISVLPGSLDFGSKTTGLTLAIKGVGGATPKWKATADHSWVTMSAASGTGAATVTVWVNRSRLAPGSYTSAVRVTSDVGSRVIVIKATVGTGGLDVGVS